MDLSFGDSTPVTLDEISSYHNTEYPVGRLFVVWNVVEWWWWWWWWCAAAATAAASTVVVAWVTIDSKPVVPVGNDFRGWYTTNRVVVVTLRWGRMILGWLSRRMMMMWKRDNRTICERTH